MKKKRTHSRRHATAPQIIAHRRRWPAGLKLNSRRVVLCAVLLGVLTGLAIYQLRSSDARGGRVAAPAVPMVTVNKTAALAPGGDVNGNGHVNPGDKLAYSVTVSNTGNEALGVIFTDQLDPNLTLEPGSVKASPIGTNDSYDCIGNVGIGARWRR